MIRFVYIGGQIMSGEREFMFYDTGADLPIMSDNQVIWESVAQFRDVASSDKHIQFARCIRLIPDWYNAGDPPPEDWHTGI